MSADTTTEETVYVVVSATGVMHEWSPALLTGWCGTRATATPSEAQREAGRVCLRCTTRRAAAQRAAEEAAEAAAVRAEEAALAAAGEYEGAAPRFADGSEVYDRKTGRTGTVVSSGHRAAFSAEPLVKVRLDLLPKTVFIPEADLVGLLSEEEQAEADDLAVAAAEKPATADGGQERGALVEEVAPVAGAAAGRMTLGAYLAEHGAEIVPAAGTLATYRRMHRQHAAAYLDAVVMDDLGREAVVAAIAALLAAGVARRPAIRSMSLAIAAVKHHGRHQTKGYRDPFPRPAAA